MGSSLESLSNGVTALLTGDPPEASPACQEPLLVAPDRQGWLQEVRAGSRNAGLAPGINVIKLVSFVADDKAK